MNKLSNTIVNTATEEQRKQVVETILLSFSTDPVLRWLYPQANEYLQTLAFFDAFSGGAIAHDSAYITPNLEGAAMWFPSGFGPDEEKLVAFVENTVRKEAVDDIFRVLEKMDEFHPENCWYLAMIGVDVGYQGRGLGTELMKKALLRCDEEGLPAYLESSNPRNIRLYQRHGFEVMGEIQSGNSPVVTPMFRPVQK